MRILKLELRSWGHFSGVTLAFPSEPAVHLVIGPNQAGKSTARRGFLSMLQGIKGDDALPVALPGAEIGAKIQVDLQEHDVQRLGRIDRGLKWLDANGRILADTDGWMPISRDVYAAVFCLDREGLDRSGRDLARSNGSLGSLFFATGVGADVLTKARDALQSRKDKLFSSNLNGKSKAVNAASAQLAQAVEEQRKHEVVDIAARDAAVASARETVDNLRALRQRLDAQVTKLTAAGGAVSQVQAVREAETSLGAVRAAGPLPDRSWVERVRSEANTLDEAERAVHEAQTELGHANEELAALPEDTAVLEQALAIDALRGRKALVDRATKDLPDLTRAQEAAATTLRTAARDAGQPIASLGEAALNELRQKVPPLETIATAKQALERRAALEDRVRQAKDTLADATTAHELAVKRKETAPKHFDVRLVREALRDAAVLGDIENELTTSTFELAERRKRVEAEFQRLGIPTCEAHSLQALRLPSAEQVGAEVAAANEYNVRQDRARHAAETAQTAIRAAEGRIRDLDATGRAPDAETLHARRGERDSGIEAFIEAQQGRPAPLAAWSQTPGPDLRAAVKEADDVADARFESAEAVTQLALAKATLVSAQDRYSDANLALTEAKKDGVAAAERWTQWLATRGLPDVPVAEAATWRIDCLKLGESLSGVEAAEKLLAKRETGYQSARKRLEDVLGDDGTDAGTWTALRGRAEGRIQEHQEAKQAEANIVGRIAAAKDAVAVGEQGLARHQRAFDEWANGWASLPKTLGLPDGAAPAAGDQRVVACAKVHSALDGYDAAHRAWQRAAETVASFESAVQAHHALTDERLPARLALDALDDRLQAATRRNQERGVVTGRISEHTQRIQTKTTTAAGARDALQALRTDAGLTLDADLHLVFERVDEASKLTTRLTDLRRTLPAELNALETTIAGRTAADLADELDVLGVKRDEAEAAWKPAVEQLVKAEQRRDEVTGLDNAAQAAERSAAIGAELAGRVQEYLEEAAAAWLLEQAIQEMAGKADDGPLSRASALFAELTNQAFDGLEAWTEGDGGQSVKYVCARRANGERLSPDQLSDGTRDQLWLALRIAVIEDHLDRGIVAPVVFDDVLVNVDDAWAEGLFRVLHTLAKRTQVVMFTHHQHLEQVARTALGAEGLTVARLAGRDPNLPRIGGTPLWQANLPSGPRLPGPPDADGDRDAAPGAGGARVHNASVEEAVLQYITENPGRGRSDVTGVLEITDAQWNASIAALRESKQVRQEGIKRGARYFAATSSEHDV